MGSEQPSAARASTRSTRSEYWDEEPFLPDLTVYDKTPRKSQILGPDGEPLMVTDKRQGFIGFIELKERP